MLYLQEKYKPQSDTAAPHKQGFAPHALNQLMFLREQQFKSNNSDITALLSN